MDISQKRVAVIFAAVGALLLIPFVAGQFTAEVNWSWSDFMIMGVLLLSAGVAGEAVWRRGKTARQRIGWLLLVVLAFVFIWAELAVGIVGSPWAGS